MFEYKSPGVYVEEVSSGIKPIEGVSTNIAGFIGEVADDVDMPPQPGKFQAPGPAATGAGAAAPKPTSLPYPVAPVNTPQQITSWEQFKNKFGDFQEGNFILAHAVYGFFNNGGDTCYVTRVANNDTADFITALDSFKHLEIQLVAIPGALSVDVQNAILDHCENEHLQNRFAILDGQRITDRGNITKAAIRGDVRDSSYGAIYYPWIKVFDPVIAQKNAAALRADPHATLEDEHRYVPPSGHIAGVYSRVDESRGVYKAPAGVDEVLRGAVDVELALSREEQAVLNPDNINVIRKFDGNITIWGARTLDVKDPEWRYINVRRVFLFLRESIDKGTQWVVFEPNGPTLWAQIKRNITAFLTIVWRGGALFGSVPEEAFYVKCDESLNPPAVRDLGQVVIEIGVAVLKPA